MSRAAAELPFGTVGTSLQAWQNSPALRAVAAITLEQLLPEGSRLVVVAPHPDDEVLACGGLLAAMAHRQEDLLLISVTDGEGSHPGSSRWPLPRLREQRRQESQQAISALGLDATRLAWLRLGLPDARVAASEDLLIQRLGDYLQPGDRVLCTWRHDGHCDHEAAGRAAAQAAMDRGAVLIEVPVWAWHWANPEDARWPWTRARKLHLNTDQQVRKRRAIQAHASQLHADPSTGAGPVLDDTTLSRLLQAFELVFL